MQLREAVFPDESESVAALFSAVHGRPISVSQIENMSGDGFVMSRCQLALLGDERIGYGWLLRQETYPAGELQLILGVHPTYRERGVGRMLLLDAEQFAMRQGYGCLSAVVDGEQSEGGAPFAERRGFAVLSHQIESKLAVASFEDDPFVRYLTRAKLNGVRFFTFGQLGDTAENRRKLYALHRELAADVPDRNSEDFPEFGQYQSGRIEAEGFDPDGCLIALARDEWIGLALLEVWDGAPVALNTITGVSQAWRGRGIAQALKLVTVRGARQFGVETLVTMNDVRNEAMLAINKKMGYRPERELIKLQKELTDSSYVP